MDEKRWLFLLELLTSREEKSFLVELVESPHDVATRNAYSDWLEDNGRDESAKCIRDYPQWNPIQGDVYPRENYSRVVPGTLGVLPSVQAIRDAWYPNDGRMYVEPVNNNFHNISLIMEPPPVINSGDIPTVAQQEYYRNGNWIYPDVDRSGG